MGRTPTPPHLLRLRNHHGRAVCSYRGKVFPFGPWDEEKGSPTAEALANFQEQQRLWSANPAAAAPGEAEDVPLAEVWARWVKTPHAPKDRNGDNRRAAELFGTAAKPGPFRLTTAAGLTAAAVLDWQDKLCGRGLSRYSVGRLVGFLKRCLAWGRVAGFVPASVVADVQLVPPLPEGATPKPVVRKGVPWERVNEACGRMRSRTAADVLRVLWLSAARRCSASCWCSARGRCCGTTRGRGRCTSG